MASKNPANFSNNPGEEDREIGAKSGHARGDHSPTTTKSHNDAAPSHSHNLRSGNSSLPGNGNLGNFANRPKEEVRAIAAMGGRASHSGGFASMNPDKQRGIASMGGHASAASDRPGNFVNRPTEEVRELAKKGVEARKAKQ